MIELSTLCNSIKCGTSSSNSALHTATLVVSPEAADVQPGVDVELRERDSLRVVHDAVPHDVAQLKEADLNTRLTEGLLGAVADPDDNLLPVHRPVRHWGDAAPQQERAAMGACRCAKK